MSPSRVGNGHWDGVVVIVHIRSAKVEIYLYMESTTMGYLLAIKITTSVNLFKVLNETIKKNPKNIRQYIILGTVHSEWLVDKPNHVIPSSLW